MLEESKISLLFLPRQNQACLRHFGRASSLGCWTQMCHLFQTFFWLLFLRQTTKNFILTMEKTMKHSPFFLGLGSFRTQQTTPATINPPVAANMAHFGTPNIVSSDPGLGLTPPLELTMGAIFQQEFRSEYREISSMQILTPNGSYLMARVVISKRNYRGPQNLFGNLSHLSKRVYFFLSHRQMRIGQRDDKGRVRALRQPGRIKRGTH